MLPIPNSFKYNSIGNVQKSFMHCCASYPSPENVLPLFSLQRCDYNNYSIQSSICREPLQKCMYLHIYLDLI